MFMMAIRIKISGTFKHTKVVNSPAQTFSVSNPGPLIITGMNIDNCEFLFSLFPNSFIFHYFIIAQGNFPNNQSNGLPAGHNTDGFDASTTDLVIENSSVKNQVFCFVHFI